MGDPGLAQAERSRALEDSAALTDVVRRCGEVCWRLKRISKWIRGTPGASLDDADLVAIGEAVEHYARLSKVLERRRGQ